ncbi:MAG TPA: cofactor-independent phosphoglycerate mutase [Candidatus Omnitrophota bacterium]|nr:cofactor-independent phosphoglycerate mutase [Candidatus Omnitrophota bacterium]HRZ15116.1 cofactor-independent phosphoglycerate mutase [Candidatus Omnitrophota bacterium]
MKYIVLVGDGMADYPIEELGGRTPLETARTPHMDFIARNGRLGKIRTVPEKMTPASDVANMSILGYDPRTYYSGRGPLEAENLGVVLEENDVAFRCNLVTIADEAMQDYSAGHISSKEAAQLIKAIDEKLGNERFKFYPGISYRHLLLVKNGVLQGLDQVACTAPHDILGKKIKDHLPAGKNAQTLLDLMQASRSVLEEQEINHVRVDLKENPANMIWLWGQGKKPRLPSFQEKFGFNGSVISAVDLIKGFGKMIGLEVINVPGATGYYDTNYEGKAIAAIKSLEKKDFVFVHVEAPDEAGHNGDLREKILAIERFDQYIVGGILEAFKNNRNFRILVLPDHATPIPLRTHTADPICFGIFGKGITGRGFAGYSEKEAEKSDLIFEQGHQLMEFFIKSDSA